MDSNAWTFLGIAVFVFGGMGYLEYRAGYRTGKQAVRHFLVMMLCATLGVVASDLLWALLGWYGLPVGLALVVAAWALWRLHKKRAAEPAQEASLNSAPRSQE
jgi:hypothetical protein